jgi:hypothetical protein
MNPWLVKILDSLIDKGFLAISGSIIAYVSARAIERYRRRQAVLLELGKIRAQAFIKVLSLLGEFHFLFDRLIKIEKTDENAAEIEALGARIQSITPELHNTIRRDLVLLDIEAGSILVAIGEQLFSLDTHKLLSGNLPKDELEKRSKKLKELWDAVRSHLPPLPKAD